MKFITYFKNIIKKEKTIELILNISATIVTVTAIALFIILFFTWKF